MSVLGRARWPLLLVIALLAFGLRVYQIDAMGFWLDEGLTPLRSGYSIPEILSNRITIQEGVTRDTHPPLHYLLIHLTRGWFGESDLGYRFPSALAGVLLIPVLYQLARRMEGERVGLVAATLAAINPLQVWYGQEARMYTLLALLGAVASWALWRALTGRDLFRWLALYLAFSGLAFYTHYTALLLTAGQAPFWIWLLWRRGHRRLLMGLGVVGVLIALPLLPMIVPRLFTGAEANYFYVPPWIMLQDVVHGFGLGLTVDFSRVGIKLLDVATAVVLVAGLVGVRRSDGEGRLGRAFLGTYLLATVVGLSLGSLIKPMYMGARHIMIGSPAFFVLLARGLFWLGGRDGGAGSRWLWRGAALMGAGVLVAGPIVSLGNLYGDPVYAKDDVRALIRHVEQRAGERDLLLYNNAIHLPLHWHYQARPDVAATALPVYPYPAGPETVAALERLAAEYDRIWFLGALPGDERDDREVVRRWIEGHLVAGESFAAHGRNLEARVTAYSTDPRWLEALPAGGSALDLAWGGVPTLRGVRLGFEEPAAGPALWLDLYWEGGAAPAPDLQVRFRLEGPDGGIWSDDSQPLWDERAFAWREVGLVRVQHGIPVPPGTPPGDYGVVLSIWDGADARTLLEGQTLATVAVADASQWPWPAKVAYSTRTGIEFENGLELRGLTWVTNRVKPGHTWPLDLTWWAETAPSDVRYRLEVVGPGGTVLRTQEGAPGADWLTVESWPTGAPVQERTGLYFPPETAPGRYRLRWSLADESGPIGGRPTWRPWDSETVGLGSLVVETWPLATEVPEPIDRWGAELGPAIELVGIQMAEDAPARGEALEVTLVWRAREVPDASYYVFVHLVRAEDGAIVSQLDRIPVDWRRPTNGWREGEMLTDDYRLPIPQDLAPGSYELVVGMYEPESWVRLPVTYRGERQEGDQLLLATLNYE
jgi:hypothetical protein